MSKKKPSPELKKLEDRIAPGGIGGALGDLGVDDTSSTADEPIKADFEFVESTDVPTTR